MQIQPGNPAGNNQPNKRPVDLLTDEVAPWWKKTFIYVRKKQIATWKGAIVLMFFAGIAAALIWSVKTDYHTSSDAAPATTFYFNPASTSVAEDTDFTLDSIIDPGTNSVSAVTLHYTFDQTRLRLDSITPSSAFSLVLAAAVINNTNGSASIDLAVPTSSPSIDVTSTMATLAFHSLTTAVTNSPVTYTSASQAAADGEPGDVVTTRNGATVTVTSSTPTYTIGGTISGLSGTVVLQNNGGDNLSRSANGAFTFATPIDDSSAYAVTVLTNPSGQSCSATSGSGTVSGANVTNVSVTCVTGEPSLSAGFPSGTLAAGTTQAILSLTTGASATCKFGTTAGVAYDSIATTFATISGTAHSYSLTGLSGGNTYNYYVRCSDASDVVNTSDYLISFSIANPASSSDGHKKKKAEPVKRKIYTTPNSVSYGKVITQSGKRFSKNAKVALYFSRANGTYYPPKTVITTKTGSFSLAYRVTKAKGTYKWYAVDLKTGKKSKTDSYKVR